LEHKCSKRRTSACVYCNQTNERRLQMSTAPFEIRPATRADVGTIFNLIQQLAEYEKLAHMVSGNEAMLTEALFGEHASSECVIALEDGRAVGFALYFTTFSTFLCKSGLYLEDVFVIPAARGRGYGKSLLVHLAGICHARGYGRFEWRVLDWNAPAIDFYKSLGASVMPEWHLVRMTATEIEALLAASTPKS
jgi:GNAT superfamily N-acetyltransferase